MFNNPHKDFVGAAFITALGASIVTTFAIAQGQHPLVGFGITAIAAIFGMICHYYGIA